jgi:hypothetical protein
MGIGGHILGEKKLRQLRQRTGLPLDRAYRRNHGCEGVVWHPGIGDGCTHYDIVWETGEYLIEAKPVHWATCPRSPAWMKT